MFTIIAARQGAALITRSGKRALFVAYHKGLPASRRLMVQVEGLDVPVFLNDCGRFLVKGESAFDLFLEASHVSARV